MSYIGKQPVVGNFQVCDAITVVNGQAAYTMQVSSANVEPENANHMLVSLNGVLQKPGSSFTISGATITFASNLATGDVIDFIILLGNVLDIGAPSDATVTNAKLASDLISGETDIGGAIADADLFLMDDGAGGTLRKTAASRIKTYVGAANTPAFHVVKTSNQSIGNASDTKVTFDSETFDTASAFASDKFTVPAGEGGKYFIYCNVAFAADSGGNRINYLYKDGASMFRISSFGGSAGSNTFASSGLIVSLSAAEYLEIYTYQSSGGSINALGTSSSPYTFFGGFKLLE